MKCSYMERWLLLRDSGELDPIRSRLLERHLATCPACRASAALLNTGRSALHAVPVPTMSEADIRTLIAAARNNAAAPSAAFAWLRPALAAAAALAIVVTGFLWSSRNTTPGSAVARATTPAADNLAAWDDSFEEDLATIDEMVLSSVSETSYANGTAADEESLAKEWLALNGVEI